MMQNDKHTHVDYVPNTLFLLPLSAAMAAALILYHWHQIPFVHQQ